MMKCATQGEKDGLRIRINEVERPLLEEKGNWKINFTKSKDHVEGEDEDMLYINIRMTENFRTDALLYWKFPFDMLDF